MSSVFTLDWVEIGRNAQISIERLRSKRWLDHIRVRSRDLVRNAG